MPTTVTVDELPALRGKDLGHSDWVAIDQERIGAFADVTDDHQFIHVDRQAAAQGPFATTIAHGFLTLSLLTRLVSPLMPEVAGAVMGINYGLDRVRFLAPVREGSRIRANVTLADINERKPGRWLAHYDVTIEIEGEETPALSARWLTMTVVA